MTGATDEIIHNGVLFDMKNWGGEPPDVNRLPEDVEQLFERPYAQRSKFATNNPNDE